MTLTNINDKLKSEAKTFLNYIVLPEQVEDEAKIAKIEFYKSTKPKLIFFYIIILFSAGIFALISKWIRPFYVRIRYVKGTPRNANYLVIHCIDGTVDYVKVCEKSMMIEGAAKTYRIFSYRLYKYYYDKVTNQFKPIEFVIKNKTFAQVHNDMSKGFSTDEAYQRRLLNYGRNSTDLPEKSNLEIIVDEILSPFYIFQLFAIIFWGFFNDYAPYAAFIFGISAITLSFDYYKIKSNHRKLKQRSSFEIDVNVFRNPEEITKSGETIVKMIPKTVSSTSLVPGDLVEVPHDQKLPCDLILINGICIMNEGMLTGESIPVIKQQLPYSDKPFDSANTALDQYILFSGTECLETRRIDPYTPVLGIVLRTGFSTMKGRLIRSFLYSKPEKFRFYQDSMRYIGAMSLLAAVCFALSVKSLVDQDESIGDIILKSLDIITVSVPPALPTVVAVGSALASIRLEKQKIVTKSEMKINVAGKVKFMCFDKTGTLTKDSLDLHGVRALSKEEDKTPEFTPAIFDNIHQALDSTPATDKNPSQKLLELMATCHSLTYVKRNISGDPLDIRMFQAVGWKYYENSGNGGFDFRLATVTPPSNIAKPGYYHPKSEVVVLKRFDFSAKLQRMSVIIKDTLEGRQRVYAKGSPEVIRTLARPETLPADFDKILLSYTQNGLRVIACGTKLLEKDVLTNDDLERESFENDLEFIGFIIFENKMKDVTTSIIKKLKDADINIIMLTGDNPLTAIFVSRDCGIIDQNQRVVLGTLVTSEEDSDSKHIEWKFIDPIRFDNTKPEETAPLNVPSPHQNVEIEMLPSQQISRNDGEIVPQREVITLLESDPTLAVAMTGEAFNFFDSSPEINFLVRDLVLQRSKVLSRMRPDDKAFVVEKIQKQGYTVGMCGDGANDCPALKAANVGVALSEAEASLAAPFMSKIIDISSVDILLREGRATLVTSFQCFKFMSIYSLIQAFTVVILYSRVSYLTDGAYLYQDLFMIIPIAFTMSLTLPTSKLSKQEPVGALVSVPVLSGMLGQALIQAAVQYLAIVLVKEQEWYESPEDLWDQAFEETGDEEATVPDYDLTILFYVGNIQYIATVMAFSIGRPFRKPFYTNICFTISVAVTLLCSVLLILVPWSAVHETFELKEFPDAGFRWIILGVVAANTFITIVFEKFFMPFMIALVTKALAKRQKTKGNLYMEEQPKK